MDEGQYILPAELAALIGFLLLPSVAVAVAGQAYYLRRTGVWRSSPRKVILGVFATVALGVSAAVATLAFAPVGLGPLLRVRELEVVGQHWPIWPAGFILLGAAAGVTTWWLNRGVKSAA